MSATVAPPPPPPRPQLSSSSTPTHAQFLLTQIQSSLTHLNATGCLDDTTYRDVRVRLDRAVLQEPAATSTRDDPTDLDTLGKRNAWMRKAMSETDLLPNVVETALSLVGGPFLGDTQISAIVQLVEMSQKNIAEAVTNPRNQRAASTSAFTGFKEAYSGVGRGVAIANERLASRRREDKERKVRRKEEKKHEKELRKELEKERSEARDRVAKVSGMLDEGTREEESSSSEDSDEVDSAPHPRIGPTHTLTPNANADPQASVAFAQVGSSSTSATTTFVPWEGVVISSTIVASPGVVASPSTPKLARALSTQEETRLRSRDPPPVPASSTAAPQPPPMHHMRSTLSTSGRNLDDIGGGDPTSTPQPADNDTIVDTTDSKRRNWKAKLLG